MLMTHIPMDHLVALAEQRQARLREEADRYRTERLARGAAGPSPVGRMWLRLRARLTATRRPGPRGTAVAGPAPHRAPRPAGPGGAVRPVRTGRDPAAPDGRVPAGPRA
ncbi:hypothetical protein [Pseudonocardia sp. ICBG1034]|uniref:hypothetical protein n=1 Tax=Pseudonocardia sp. ICBG1034 TaxID=2844381 RepID=UPI001CCA0980|nr:hypothetical protein [Pseudonocardia sp. ICBG1034]